MCLCVWVGGCIMYLSVIFSASCHVTSQFPIFKMDAGKLEALSLASAVTEALAPFWSFLLTACNLVLSSWESRIWIKSKRDGLFLRRNPSGLGSSRGLYKAGGIERGSSLHFHCRENQIINYSINGSYQNWLIQKYINYWLTANLWH